MLNKLFRKKVRSNKVYDPAPIKTLIPNGWYVHEAGQDPLHMLWFVVLMNFDDVANNVEKPRHFISEEFDSFDEALQNCIKELKSTN